MNIYLYLLFVSIYYRDFAKIKILLIKIFQFSIKKTKSFLHGILFIYLFIKNDSK